MDEVARIVLALETPDVAEEVMHFLDRTGRARVVGTAVDAAQRGAVRQLEPDAVVAAPSLVPARGTLNGSALLAVDTSQSVGHCAAPSVAARAASTSGRPSARSSRSPRHASDPSRTRRAANGRRRWRSTRREAAPAGRSSRRTLRPRSPSVIDDAS